MKFKEYITEQSKLKEIPFKGLDSNMIKVGGIPTDDVKDWDRVYTFSNKSDYNKGSRKLTDLVAAAPIWKTEHNDKKLVLFIKFNR